MFFGKTNKNYLNKHNSLMFNGYQINKGTVFKYTNNNILSQPDRSKNYYKQSQLLDRYNIVVNNPSIKILNRNTDFRKKYYGYDVNKKKNDSFYDEVENETIIKHDIIPLKNNIITTQNTIKEGEKEKSLDPNKNTKYEIDKEIKTNLSFDRWQSSNDVFNHIKEVEKKLNLLKTNMENQKIEYEKKEHEKIEYEKKEHEKIEYEKKEHEKKITLKHNPLKREHPYKKITQTFIEGDNVQICWTPNKWVDGVIDEITIGGLYYVRHMTERENNYDAEMTWTRSLVNSEQIRRK